MASIIWSKVVIGTRSIDAEISCLEQLFRAEVRDDRGICHVDFDEDFSHIVKTFPQYVEEIALTQLKDLGRAIASTGAVGYLHFDEYMITFNVVYYDPIYLVEVITFVNNRVEYKTSEYHSSPTRAVTSMLSWFMNHFEKIEDRARAALTL